MESTPSNNQRFNSLFVSEQTQDYESIMLPKRGDGWRRTVFEKLREDSSWNTWGGTSLIRRENRAQHIGKEGGEEESRSQQLANFSGGKMRVSWFSDPSFSLNLFIFN